MNRSDRWMCFAVVAIMIFNVFDCGFTSYWVHARALKEANPVMSSIVLHPFLFGTVKTLMVFMGSVLLFFCRHNLVAKIGICVCFTLYLSVVVYHLYYFFTL